MKKNEKTDIIDMLSELQKEIPDKRAKVSPVPMPDENQTALLEKLSKEKISPTQSYIDDKTMHQSLKQADKEAVDWANKTREINYNLNKKIQKRNEIRNKQKLLEKTVKLKNPNIKASGILGLILGLGSMAASEDVLAGVPVLSEASSVGPEVGMEDYEIENPQANPQARKAALQKILGR